MVMAIDSEHHPQSRLVPQPPIRGVYEAYPHPPVVLLIHGIRTRAAWQSQVKPALEQDGVAEAVPIGFGYFNLLCFLWPFGTRGNPVNTVHKKIAAAMRRFPTARLSAIAHSFGTYALVTILHDFANIPLERVILCGSVVDRGFPWHHLQLSDVLNECARRDVLPVLAERTTWGYSSTGTFGFGTPGVRDRFHDLFHSGCLTPAFAHEFWSPWILHGRYQPGIQVQSSPWYVSLADRLPLRWAIIGGILFAVWQRAMR